MKLRGVSREFTSMLIPWIPQELLLKSSVFFFCLTPMRSPPQVHACDKEILDLFSNYVRILRLVTQADDHLPFPSRRSYIARTRHVASMGRAPHLVPPLVVTKLVRCPARTDLSFPSKSLIRCRAWSLLSRLCLFILYQATRRCQRRASWVIYHTYLRN